MQCISLRLSWPRKKTQTRLHLHGNAICISRRHYAAVEFMRLVYSSMLMDFQCWAPKHQFCSQLHIPSEPSDENVKPSLSYRQHRGLDPT